MVLKVISESSESSSSESSEDDLWTEEDFEPFVLWDGSVSRVISFKVKLHQHQPCSSDGRHGDDGIDGGCRRRWVGRGRRGGR